MVRNGLMVAAAACALLLAGFPAAVQAAPIDNVFVFGDSLSDVGNLCLASPGNCPPSPPYAPEIGRAHV